MIHSSLVSPSLIFILPLPPLIVSSYGKTSQGQVLPVWCSVHLHSCPFKEEWGVLEGVVWFIPHIVLLLWSSSYHLHLKFRRVTPLSHPGYEWWTTCVQSTLTGYPMTGVSLYTNVIYDAQWHMIGPPILVWKCRALDFGRSWLFVHSKELFLAPSELYKCWCLSVWGHYAYSQLMMLLELTQLMDWAIQWCW